MAPSIRTQFSRRCPALCGVGGTLHRGSWGSTVGASAVGLGGCSYLSLRFYSIVFLCFSAFSYLSITISIMIYLSLSIYHCLSIYLTNLPIDPCIHVSMYPCIHPSIRPSIHPSTYIVLRVHISTWYMDRYSSYPSTGWTNIGHSNRVERWLGLVKSVHGIVTLW